MVASSPSLTPNSSPNPNIRNEWLSHLSVSSSHGSRHHTGGASSSSSSSSRRHSHSNRRSSHSRRGSISLLHTPNLYALNSPQVRGHGSGTSVGHAGPPPFALSGGHHHVHQSLSPFLAPIDPRNHHHHRGGGGLGHTSAPMSPPPPRHSLSVGGARARQPFDLSLISPVCVMRNSPLRNFRKVLARSIESLSGLSFDLFVSFAMRTFYQLILSSRAMCIPFLCQPHAGPSKILNKRKTKHRKPP